MVLVFREKAEQLGVHHVGHLFVGVVAHVGDEEDLALGQNLRRPARVRGELRPVDLAAEDQRPGLDVGPVVDHRVHRPQVAAEPAYVGQPGPVAAQALAVADAQVVDELGPPLHVAARVGPHVGLVGRLQVRVGVDLAVVRLKAAPRAAVGQADLVDGHQMRRPLGVEEGEPGGHLPADGMADDARLVDAEVVHEPGGVGGVQAHAVGQDGFRRLAPAEPVLHHDPVAGAGEGLDLALPVPAVVAAAVVQDDRAAVRRARRRDVHVRDAHVLAVDPEIHEVDGVRVLVPFEVDRDRPPVGRRLRRRMMRLGRDRDRQGEGQHQHGREGRHETREGG